MSTGITQSPRPSSSRFRWTPADIALGAALGVGCGLVFWGFNFAYTPISSVLGPFCLALRVFCTPCGISPARSPCSSCANRVLRCM